MILFKAFICHTTGATSGTGTAFPFETSDFLPGF